MDKNQNKKLYNVQKPSDRTPLPNTAKPRKSNCLVVQVSNATLL